MSDHIELYPAHPKNRRFSFEIMRKLSVTWSRKSRRCFGMVSRKNRRIALANCFWVVWNRLRVRLRVTCWCIIAHKRSIGFRCGQQGGSWISWMRHPGRQECPHVWSFVVGSVAPDDVDAALSGVSGLDFSQQLHRTFAINGGGFYKRPVEVFQIHRTVDIDPPAPRCPAECRV